MSEHVKSAGHPFAFIIGLCLVAVLSGGCLQGAQSKMIERRNSDNFVRLRSMPGRSKFYSHPREFTTAHFRMMLRSVNFARYRFFRWMEPAALFSRVDIEFLAPALSKAFAEVGARQVVQFCVLDNPGATPGRTGGRLFVKGETLQLVLEELVGEKYHDGSRQMDPSWKLSPVEYQSLATKPGIAGDVSLENHLVFDLSSVPLMRFQLEADMDVRQKLRELRSLYEQGLITEEQYRAKQARILDEAY